MSNLIKAYKTSSQQCANNEKECRQKANAFFEKGKTKQAEKFALLAVQHSQNVVYFERLIEKELQKL